MNKFKSNKLGMKEIFASRIADVQSVKELLEKDDTRYTGVILSVILGEFESRGYYYDTDIEDPTVSTTLYDMSYEFRKALDSLREDFEEEYFNVDFDWDDDVCEIQKENFYESYHNAMSWLFLSNFYRYDTDHGVVYLKTGKSNCKDKSKEEILEKLELDYALKGI